MTGFDELDGTNAIEPGGGAVGGTDGRMDGRMDGRTDGLAARLRESSGGGRTDGGTDGLAARLRESSGGGRGAAAESRVAAAVARSLVAAVAEGAVDAALARFDSPLGPMVLGASPAGLVTVDYGAVDDVADRLAGRLGPRVVIAGTPVLDQARRELDEYFARRRRRFEVPLDWSLSRGFRRRVLERAATLGYGEVTTYGDLAAEVGNPRGARAVGGAMGSNPIPVIVPCHRVLAAGGGLGGYTGGLDRKRLLLRLEGVLPE